jgi:hypothetical protein
MSKLTKLSTLLLITLLTLTLTVSLASAATTGLWSYGEGTYDMAINNIGIMDGGHIIVGSTEGYGAVGEDLWMFKVDNTGAAAWNKHYGGAGNESGFNVIGTSDGSYAVVGCTTSYGAGMEDIWLIKTDADGNIAWNKTYGGVYDDEGWMILQTSDGGYLITGITCPVDGLADAFLLKVDSTGTQEWMKTYGGNGDDGTYGITPASAGGYILAGFTNSTGAGKYDAWLIRVDAQGTQQWTKNYGGTENDVAYQAFETSETDFVVDGTTRSYGAGKADIWLFMTDAMGGMMWNYTYGGPEVDSGWYGVKTLDGYALGGYTYSYGTNGNAAAWLVKVDKHGMTMWNQTYGTGEDYYGWAVTETADNGFAISGQVESPDGETSRAFLVITDSSGNSAIPKTNAELIPLWMVGAIVAVIIVLLIVVIVLLKRKPKQTAAEQPQPQQTETKTS